jgi:hypothetical protein
MIALARALRPRRVGPARPLHLLEDCTHLFIPGLSLGRATLNQGGQFDVARCPLCRGPLITRVGRSGPYFHCLCPPRTAA